MKTLIALLLIPYLSFAQDPSLLRQGGINKNPSINPANRVKPVKIQAGNAVNALYKIAYNKSQDGSDFNVIIYTQSFRETLHPSDCEALVTVDGLGKIFKLQNWTSRFQNERITSSIVLQLNKEELKSIGFAGTVGIKIGSNSFQIPYRYRHPMRQLVMQAESGKGHGIVFLGTMDGIKVLRSGGNPDPELAERYRSID